MLGDLYGGINMSDQEIISPYNSDTISSTQVIKNKNKGNIN